MEWATPLPVCLNFKKFIQIITFQKVVIGFKKMDESGVEPETFPMLRERATNYATRPEISGP